MSDITNSKTTIIEEKLNKNPDLSNKTLPEENQISSHLNSKAKTESENNNTNNINKNNNNSNLTLNQNTLNIKNFKSNILDNSNSLQNNSFNKNNNDKNSNSNNSNNENENPKINIKTENRFKKSFIYLLSVNASLSYLFLGFNIGVTDTLHDNLIALYGWDKKEAKHYLSILSSVLAIGALIGALFVSPYLLKRGRRFSIIIGNIIGLIGVALMNFLVIQIMILGRFIIGITIGIFTTCVGIYIKEYVPYDIAGTCGSIYELNYSIGIFLSYVLGLNLPTSEEIKDNPGNNWWRFMLSVPALFALLSIFLFVFQFKLETPLFLFINKNDSLSAQKALEQIYFKKSEIKQILNDYKSLSENRELNISFKDLFSSKYRKRFLIALMLLITQQACGIDGFLMYSNSLFMQSVHNERKATILTNFCGVFLILSGITTFLIIEKLGRKFILVIGQLLMLIILLLLAYFYFIKEHSPVVYLIISYIYLNGVSLSPLSFIYSADVLPDIGMGFCLGMNNVFSFIVTETFMYLFSSRIGTYGLMLIFAFFVFLDLVVIVFFLKETGGLSADEIDRMYTPKKENETLLGE